MKQGVIPGGLGGGHGPPTFGQTFPLEISIHLTPEVIFEKQNKSI